MSVSTPMFAEAIADRESWHDDANCRGVDIDIFFSLDDLDQKNALELCKACPVRRECLQDALEQHEMYGIWGGTTESDRRSMIRDHRRQERERRADAA